MISLQLICAILTSVIGSYNTISYLIKTLKRQIKPHCFTWVICGSVLLLSSIALFKAQAGLGAYTIGLSGMLCLTVGIVAIFIGHKQITTSDIVAGAFAVIAIILWQTTKDPLLALKFTTLAHVTAYYPTFRKAYHDPFNENPRAFATYMLVNVLTMLAMKTYSITTILYPAGIFFANFGLVSFIYLRRKKLSGQ